MSTRWRIVDLTGYAGDVGVRRGSLVVDSERVFLDDVAVILAGRDTAWSGNVTALAARYQIPILGCDWRGIPYACTLPWSENTRVGARHRAQADLSRPRQKNAWMQIVKAKIHGQASNLCVVDGPSGRRLEELAGMVRSGDPDNVEARAARMYWSRLFADEHFVRRLGSGSGRNAQLDYGYAIIRGLTVRAVCVAGLWPTLGLWHHNRSNGFGLADDLVEPFRPAVDFQVLRSAIVEGGLDAQAKRRMVDTIALPYGENGATVASAISELAQRLARYVEGDAVRLTVRSWLAADG